MKTMYIDCFSGISGDMLIGALVDIGVPLDFIISQLEALPVSGYSMEQRKVKRSGMAATKVDVILSEPHHHNAVRWRDIKAVIDSSSLAADLKDKALAIFKNIFTAEAKVHGEAFEDVHLHELGGIDCMVDVVGALIALKYLGVDQIIASPINLGSGFVETDHGRLPVPAPATAELLRGFEVYGSTIPFELTTPTGAAIIASLSMQQSQMPLRIDKIGCGAGNRDITEQPNLLRILLGEADSITSDESVYIVETNIDDMNPQFYDPLMTMLLNSGARDVYLENLIMKKGRPAIKLTAIADKSDIDEICRIIFRHTTTIGIRYYRADRQTLQREQISVHTSYGDVRVKRSRHKGVSINQSPEFSDMLYISERFDVPLKEVERQVWSEIIKRRDQD